MSSLNPFGSSESEDSDVESVVPIPAPRKIVEQKPKEDVIVKEEVIIEEEVIEEEPPKVEE
jgi:hypothetical protein